MVGVGGGDGDDGGLLIPSSRAEDHLLDPSPGSVIIHKGLVINF